MNALTRIALLGCAAIATPALAQDAGEPGIVAEAPTETAVSGTVFDGDFLSVGLGIAYGASYSGSDDYQAFVLPIVQGSLGGVDISPRPAGVALDFIPDRATGPNLSLGPVVRLNRDRVDLDGIDDEIVRLYGELDTAIEIGPSVGIAFPAVLNPFDSLSVNLDAAWDVAGAHSGMSVSPSIAYFTPLSRGIAASLAVSTTYIDDDYADYYYSVPPIANVAPGDNFLPGFEADGGFESVGANLLLGVDLNGDVTDGGLALVAIGGYSRLLGDAADTPFTSIRGDADQFLIALGLGYTF